MNGRIYLDYNATAPMRAPVMSAMQRALERGGNASSIHVEGRQARSQIETARQQVGDLVGADVAGLIFTSGGTEACNLALRTRRAPAGDIKRLIISAVEHAAVMSPARASDLLVEILDVDADGVVSLAALDRLLEDPTPTLVAVMIANNETGVIQPVAQIGERVRAHGSVFFCDGVQAGGKIPLDMRQMNIDLLSLSAHKIGGPTGIGALVAASHIVTGGHLLGGGQELRRRAGTENLSGIVGFGIAAKIAAQEFDKMQALAVWRDEIEAKLLAALPEVIVFGKSAQRLPNTSCFAVPQWLSESLVISLDLDGFAVSAGAACSSGKVTRSHVLDAMRIGADLSAGALRLSLGWQSQPEDGAAFVDALTKLINKRADA